MSSSEQAPEPTMDEILASIRKIISDDEPGDSPQTETAAPEAPPAESALVDDLANALDEAQAEPEAIDDILDLTTVVSENAPSDARQSDDPQIDALQAALGDAMGTPASETLAALGETVAPQVSSAPNPQDAAAGDQASGNIDISAVLAEAGIEEAVSAPASDPAPAAAALADDLSAALEQNDAPEPDTASTEATSITEALSAIEPMVADPAPVAPPTSTDAEMAETADAPADEPAPEVQAEASIDKGVYTPEADEAVAEAPAAVPVETDAGSAASDTSGEPATEPGDGVADTAPEVAAVVPAPVAEPEPVAEAVPAEEAETVEAAPASDAGDGRTLEDSVKDMLRPMLREWLDENMERIVQKEVSTENLKGSDS